MAAPSDGAGQSGFGPAIGTRVLRVLYLFAGARRKSGLARSLKIACKGTGIAVTVDEIDILRGGRRHDLLSRKRQATFRDRIKRGYYHLTAASPPCGSFSRARSANRRGPKPIRSKKFLRGFPWLRGASLLQATCANAPVDFTTLALNEQLGNGPGLVILEHPEDLGKVGNDMPGSIWQFEAVRKLVDQPGVTTGALRQSDFGTAYQKPTRLVCRLPGIEDHLFVGWPSFDNERRYTGPLPKPEAPTSTYRTTRGSFQNYRYRGMAGKAVPLPCAADGGGIPQLRTSWCSSEVGWVRSSRNRCECF